MSSSAERRDAARLLLRVDEGAYASRLLEKVSGPGVRARVLGVCRWRLAIDRVLASFVKRPLDRLDPEILVCLRMAVFEACLLGVPAPVAVSQAVDLARKLGKKSASGLVNAVGRKAVGAWQARFPEDGDAAIAAHPDWLIERWQQRWGQAEVLRVAQVDQTPAQTWAWALSPEAATALSEAHPFVADAGRHPEGDARTVTLDGVVIQDPASQWVAQVAAEIAPRGGSVLDLCAAPGGKTSRLAVLRPDLRLVANDPQQIRARRLRDVLDRRGLSVPVVRANGEKIPFDDESLDLVLVDAPCSGTGTLRRHPEIRWRLEVRKIDELAALQMRLVLEACRVIKSGGCVVYATCSVEKEENEGVVAELLERDQRLRIEPFGGPGGVTEVGGRCLLPGPSNDGFGIHVLRKS